MVDEIKFTLAAAAKSVQAKRPTGDAELDELRAEKQQIKADIKAAEEAIANNKKALKEFIPKVKLYNSINNSFHLFHKGDNAANHRDDVITPKEVDSFVIKIEPI